MTSSYDTWLSTQEWNDIHHTEELIMLESEDIYQAIVKGVHREKTIYALADDCFDEMKCFNCDTDVGNTLHSETDGGYYLEVIGFWQLDEDGEYLFCEDCYEKALEEGD
jgi:hypothetical protein